MEPRANSTLKISSFRVHLEVDRRALHEISLVACESAIDADQIAKSAVLSWILDWQADVIAWIAGLPTDPAKVSEDETISLLLDVFRNWVQHRNQFADVSLLSTAEIAKVLEAWLFSLRTFASQTPEQRIESTVSHAREACAALKRSLEGLLGSPPREVVCAEYTPNLQIEVLGVTQEELLEPVLDVGCGSDGAMVVHLRKHGITAFGIDRNTLTAFGEVADWITWNYGRLRWGTVLSHMAFSLHFLHRHFRPGEPPADYARAYMKILESLQIGGSFVYTPGLPFLEAVLPRGRFMVTQRALPTPQARSAFADLESRAGVQVSYVAIITRLAE